MKKIHKINLILLNLILFLICVVTFSNIEISKYSTYNISDVKNMMSENATVVNNELLETSTLEDLELDFNELPTVTVNTDYTYIIEGEDGVNRSRPQIGETDSVKQPIKSVSFSNLPFDQFVDLEVIASFEKCGTLNNKSIDMKIVYSNFYSAEEYTGENEYYKNINNTKTLWWTAYGKPSKQTSDNKWGQIGFKNMNVKIYFYYHGETNPIQLENAYFTSYLEKSDDLEYVQGISSKNTTNAILAENSVLKCKENLIIGQNTYNSVYYGTSNSDDLKNNAITFQYTNTERIDFDMHTLELLCLNEYHINFLPIITTLPKAGTQNVSNKEIQSGSDIIYTINQKMPNALDENFYLSSMAFIDKLDENLTYKGLIVYDENNVDITETAGSIKIENNNLQYVFNEAHLKNILYKGQEYKFVINTQISDSPQVNQINNSATISLNDLYNLETNTIQVDIISYLNIKYVDEEGKEISAPQKIKGKLNEEYKVEPKTLENYEIVTIPENSTGKFLPEIQEIEFKYRTTVFDLVVCKSWIDDFSAEGITKSGLEAAGIEMTRPDSIKIELSANIENFEKQIIEMTDTGQTMDIGVNTGGANMGISIGLDDEEEVIPEDAINNEWYYVFEDLEKYDENGNEIVYTVEEIDVPDGYVSSVSTDESGIMVVSNIAVRNLLTINNYDNITKEPLEGAEFKVEQVYNDQLYEVSTYKTDSEGKAEGGYLSEGTYQITQIKASDGYNLSSEIYTLEIVAGQTNYELDVPSKKAVELPAAGGDGIKNKYIHYGIILISISVITAYLNSRIKYKNKTIFKHRY